MSGNGPESMLALQHSCDLGEPATEVLAVRKDVEASRWALAGHGLLRVLIADGNRDAADSLSMLVKRWGHDVRQAYDGPTALEMTSAYRPDVLFLEMALPRMDGCQLAQPTVLQGHAPYRPYRVRGPSAPSARRRSRV